MPDFLLEIGCEEIPARMLDGARDVLRMNIWGLLGSQNVPARDKDGKTLQPEAITAFASPRRLAVMISGLPDQQPEMIERINGPSVKSAFKEGKPTQAAEAFAKKVGKAVGDLDFVKTDKGEYLSASVTTPGRPLKEILAENLPKTIGQLNWPKNMYWRKGKPERFVRPIRWIVALLDAEVIPLEYAGITAGSVSSGHRILGAKRIQLRGATHYERDLYKSFVIASSDQRREKILEQLTEMAKPEFHLRVDRSFAPLLDEVTNLTEWPCVIRGTFDERFLCLPEEVLVTVMRDHQKYFALEHVASGELAPHFLAVLNTDRDPDGLIRHSNERVLRARFNDAQFFWAFDNQSDFRQRRELLKRVVFHKELGNYYEKTERMERLAATIASALNQGGVTVDRNIAVEAARLAKNDLTTELVKEFTELQGIVGGRYAERQGLEQAVADAIYDHYKPASTDDAAPRTLEGGIVSIADKADSIAGMFGWTIPTGSKDPFALRRQANGILKVIVQHQLPLRVSWLMQQAREGYTGSVAERSMLNRDASIQAVTTFFRERLEFYLRDTLGLAYDVVNATLAADANDVVDAIARAQAVAKVRPSPDFESISISFKRMKNILRQAAETNKRVADPFDARALKEKEEKNLAAQVPQVAVLFNVLRTEKQYEPALLEISKLRPVIDAFFDKVMVMVEDEKLRSNRLGLLQTLVREFSSIADFSEIVTEGK